MNKDIDDFLIGKTDTAIELFRFLLLKFEEIGPTKIHATKSMIAISSNKGFAYIINLGKAFIDIALPFDEPFENNLCFRKISLVPGTDQYNHHLRMMIIEDINDEVFGYMKQAYERVKL